MESQPNVIRQNTRPRGIRAAKLPEGPCTNCRSKLRKKTAISGLARLLMNPCRTALHGPRFRRTKPSFVGAVRRSDFVLVEVGQGHTVARMSTLSPRLAEIVNALPIRSGMRVLEIGCGPGAAARAVAAQLGTGHILAVDRSAKAIAQAEQQSVAEIASGRMSLRQVSAEELVLLPGEDPFDLAFAVRVGAFDGRHPEAGREALARIAVVLRPGGRLFVDGGRPLREVPLPPVIDRQLSIESRD
jgi:SAM-dependent methyltransferase